MPDPLTFAFQHRGAILPVSYRYRAGRGETLLFLHGLGSTNEDFVGAWDVPEWSDHTVVAFDAPACGATGGYRPGIPLGVDDIVDAALALAAHLELDRLSVVGHSMGGLAALLLALRGTASVRRLVSVEGNLGPEDCSIYSRRVFRERFLGREAQFLEGLTREMRASDATGFAEAADTLAANVQTPAFFDYCRSIVEYSDGLPLLDEFVALPVPKLYVHGAENAHLTHIPHLERNGIDVCSVPGASHFPVASNPAFFYRALADFIAGSGGRS